MTLNEILRIVESSDLADWATIEQKIVDHWSGSEPIEHSKILINRSDIDISIAFGAVIDLSYSAPFLEKFIHGDGHAKRVAVVLRYRGNVVQRWSALLIDGARNLLLEPKLITTDGPGRPVIRKADLPIARLIFGSYNGAGYQLLEDALRDAQIEIVDHVK